MTVQSLVLESTGIESLRLSIADILDHTIATTGVAIEGLIQAD